MFINKVYKQIVQPPRAAQSAAMRRFRHAFAVFQGFFGTADTDVLQHFFRADARPCGKFALQMFGTDVHCRRHLRQIGLLGGMVVKVFDGAGNARELADLFGVHGLFCRFAG